MWFSFFERYGHNFERYDAKIQNARDLNQANSLCKLHDIRMNILDASSQISDNRFLHILKFSNPTDLQRYTK